MFVYTRKQDVKTYLNNLHPLTAERTSWVGWGEWRFNSQQLQGLGAQFSQPKDSEQTREELWTAVGNPGQEKAKSVFLNMPTTCRHRGKGRINKKPNQEVFVNSMKNYCEKMSMHKGSTRLGRCKQTLHRQNCSEPHTQGEGNTTARLRHTRCQIPALPRFHAWLFLHLTISSLLLDD